jgi:hypothetical protein
MICLHILETGPRNTNSLDGWIWFYSYLCYYYLSSLIKDISFWKDERIIKTLCYNKYAAIEDKPHCQRYWCLPKFELSLKN